MLTVVAAAADAGGARALLPVVRQLSATPGCRVRCHADRPARDIWTRAGLAPGDIAGADLSGVDRVVCGTSVNDRQAELGLMEGARARGTWTLAVLDSWLHYRERFTTREGRFVLPDVIAVMDPATRDDMVAEGFPAHRLVVTGQPAFDDLAPYRDGEARARASRRLRRLAGCAPAAACVLYVSQPFSQLGADALFGFHESAALADVVRALGTVLDRRAEDAMLVVKLHPRERDRPPALPVPSSPRLQVGRLDDESGLEPREMVAGSDLVIGMSSILLVEACLVGSPVLSYQPDLRIADPLPSNRLGWSRAVYDVRDLDQAIEAELFDPGARHARACVLGRLAPPRGATERVLDLLLAGGKERSHV